MSFDYEKLLKAAGGDEELVNELVCIFRDEYPKLLAKMESGIQDNNPHQLHEAAHTLKGPLASMGANEALDQVVVLETMGINKDLQLSEVGYARLKDQMDQLERDIKSHERVCSE